MYTLSFSLTDADYFEFNRHHHLGKASSGKFIRAMRVIMLVMAGIVAFLTYVVGFRADLIIICTVALVLVFGYDRLVLILLKLQISGLKKKGKLPYGKNVQMQFDEETYTEVNELNESITKYTALERVVKGREAIYLYIGAMQASIIPFSAFETEKDNDDFLAFIISKTPSR